MFYMYTLTQVHIYLCITYIHIYLRMYFPVYFAVYDADGDVVRCRWAESTQKECGAVCQNFPATLHQVGLEYNIVCMYVCRDAQSNCKLCIYFNILY